MGIYHMAQPGFQHSGCFAFAKADSKAFPNTSPALKVDNRRLH